jgi:hypothetical protein
VLGYGGAALGLMLGLTLWEAVAILLLLGQGSTLSVLAALGLHPRVNGEHGAASA